MPENEELLAWLRKLEDENRRLAVRIDELTVTKPVGVAGIGRLTGPSGVYGQSLDAEGVSGVSNGTAGVHGNCQNDSGFGVFGDGSYGAIGVYGHSGRNSGVVGIANEGFGVRGLDSNPEGTGVMGIAIKPSLSARGGVFTGGAAQVRLVPGDKATPPATGQTGDLYVDSAGGLWFGKPANWVKLA